MTQYESNIPSIQSFFGGENSDMPFELITANDNSNSLQIYSLRSSSVTSKSLYKILKI